VSAPIESYGLIGDCEAAALVGRDGSIDWLCWPCFDSDACFAKLLGGQSNGFWLITSSETPQKTSRCYRPDTLILETTFETASGKATLIDFMLPHGNSSDLVRIARCDDGEVTLCMELVMRFGYGATTPWVTQLKDGGIKAVAGPDMAVLRTPAALRGENFKTVAQFTLAKGKAMPFVLSYGPSHLPAPAPVEPLEALDRCEKFWRDWTARTKTDGCGPYTEAIKRSLITLKALTYLPSGGIVAAPTTSLPEQFGSERNWDYRLCWLRDATLTLLALMNAGVYDEAAAWRDADHVRPDGRAPLEGMGNRLVAGLCRLEAGARRQRRPRAVPARCLWRADGRLRAVAQRRAGRDRGRVGAATRPGRTRRHRVGPARPRHLGGTRTAAAFRLLQGHGLGRLRPCGESRGGARTERSGRAMAQVARPHFRRSLRQGLRRQAQHLPRRL
jgi:hypothetical protein